MGWRVGSWASGAWAGTAWATQSAPTEVPDVVGALQADGTSTLEGAGFVVAVATAYSSVVPAGTIISQSPVGGSFAQLGSTVTITVSLGEEPEPPEPESPAKVGGDDVPLRRSPHPGHDKRRAQLKRTEEQKLVAEIRAIYRELTGAPETRATAEAIIEAELPGELRPTLDDREARSAQLAEQLRTIGRVSVDSEIALRMLRVELDELLEQDDEAMIQQLLAQVL